MLLATRGQRDLDNGLETISDQDEAHQLRGKAHRMIGLSLAVALGYTAIVFAVA
ncbi:MAG: hypothetical protein IT585_03985 [candidate division Zixibacteria bacterium]|nr:hypothetical protein [candidate division Zixibacteria bacterium]